VTAAETTSEPVDNRGSLVDTHAHLQWPSLSAEVDAVLARAREAGVTRILTLGTEPASCRAAVALAQGHDGVYAAVGVHPGDVPQDIAAALDDVAELLEQPCVVAIGETGLDYYHDDNPPREAQIASFRRHLDLAAQTGLPVCIHNRDATSDIMTILDQYAGRIRPVLHCFTGDQGTARAAVEMGCYLSFAGNATYPKLRDVLAVAAEVPDDRILLETDAPFLAPQPRRGRRNEPAHITFTYDAIATARGTTRARLGQTVARNAQALFGWPDEDVA